MSMLKMMVASLTKNGNQGTQEIEKKVLLQM